MPWDPAWGHLVVGCPEGGVIVGGADAGEEPPSRAVIDHLRNSLVPQIDRPIPVEQDRLYAAVEGRPVVMVSEPGPPTARPRRVHPLSHGGYR